MYKTAVYVSMSIGIILCNIWIIVLYYRIWHNAVSYP